MDWPACSFHTGSPAQCLSLGTSAQIHQNKSSPLQMSFLAWWRVRFDRQISTLSLFQPRTQQDQLKCSASLPLTKWLLWIAKPHLRFICSVYWSADTEITAMIIRKSHHLWWLWLRCGWMCLVYALHCKGRGGSRILIRGSGPRFPSHKLNPTPHKEGVPFLQCFSAIWDFNTIWIQTTHTVPAP